MAIVATNATVTAGTGIGPVMHICTVATGTITVAAAAAALSQGDGGTVVGVSGTGNGAYVLVQGGPTPSVTGVTVVAQIG
jgi:hypothetical protein